MRSKIRDELSRLARFESLEDRRLLAQTPQLLFDVSFDWTNSEGEDSLSRVFQVQDAFLARKSQWVETSGRLVVATPTGESQELAGLPTQEVTRFAEFNDELYLFFDSHDWNFFCCGVGQEIWKTDGKSVELVKAISEVGTHGRGDSNQFVFELNDQMVLRFLVSRERGNNTRIKTYAFELPSESKADVAGDANRDGEVSFADFLLLSANFGKVDAVWADGDFNGDELVDFADFLLLAENFSEPNSG